MTLHWTKKHRSVKGWGLALLCALVLAACSSGKLSNAPGSPVDMPEADKKSKGLEALLFSKGGSSAQGKVTIAQKGERWLLMVSMFAVPPASRYRIAFFDNGNCSSPNAFSAGKIWQPPDTPAEALPDRWIPMQQADGRGNVEMVVRLPNPKAHNEDVFRKRSVLVFEGSEVEVLKPGVRNNVIACGVFDSIQLLF